MSWKTRSSPLKNQEKSRFDVKTRSMKISDLVFRGKSEFSHEIRTQFHFLNKKNVFLDKKRKFWGVQSDSLTSKLGWWKSATLFLGDKVRFFVKNEVIKLEKSEKNRDLTSKKGQWKTWENVQEAKNEILTSKKVLYILQQPKSHNFVKYENIINFLFLARLRFYPFRHQYMNIVNNVIVCC